MFITDIKNITSFLSADCMKIHDLHYFATQGEGGLSILPIVYKIRWYIQSLDTEGEADTNTQCLPCLQCVQL